MIRLSPPSQKRESFLVIRAVSFISFVPWITGASILWKGESVGVTDIPGTQGRDNTGLP